MSSEHRRKWAAGSSEPRRTSHLGLTVLVTAVAMLGASVAMGQPAMGRGGGRGPGARSYDPSTVETVTGVVQSVQQVKDNARGKGYGIHLLLKTDTEELSVHLGPGWYVEKQSLKIAPQDRIEVHGSRVVYEGKPAIIAAEVKKDDQVLKLRAADGTPVWRGQGRRP